MSKERGLKCYLVILKGSAEDVFLYWLLPAEEVIVSCGENYSFQPRKQTFLPVENCRLLNNNLLDAV